ncbi:MAG: phosphatidylglycerophosphatase A [Candidatus Bathyarchaeia archaeon]|nr:adenosylcobinamide amidohydrolase [Candidatus Bathyarchaeota archaeon]
MNWNIRGWSIRMSNLPVGAHMKCSRESLIIKSERPVRALSSAVLNGGFRRVNSIIVRHVPKNFRCRDPQTYLATYAYRLGLTPDSTAGFMTAAYLDCFGLSSLSLGKVKVSTVATAGTSNSMRAGEKPALANNAGTVNIIVLMNVRATDSCLVNAVQTVTEAKSLVFKELDIRSSISHRLATGTSTDAVMVGSVEEGPKHHYAGPGTALGMAIANTVHRAVKEAIEKQDGATPNRPLLTRLEERGIRIKDLEDSFMENYIHHKALGSKIRVRRIFRRLLEEAASDHNVAALVLGALHLDDDGYSGLIPSLPEKKYSRDPVSLLADEILGMAISNYIAGAKGVFEYVRFDRAKPGIIRRLGPFADDAVGALVAGVSSNVYTKLGRRR